MYKFYFDESAHTRAISFNPNKGVNIFNTVTDKMNDLFIGFFIGVEEEKHLEVEHQFLVIENYIKGVLGLSDKQELKGDTIKTTKFKHGFNSIHKSQIALYQSLFSLLGDKDIIIHIHMMSKTEFMLQSYFKSIEFPDELRVNKLAFIYTIIKFLFHYRKIELLEKMFDTQMNLSVKFLDELKYELKQIVENTQNVNRMEREVLAFKHILKVLELTKITVLPKEKYQWEYTLLFEGFNFLIEELKIPKSQVSLQLDPEGTNEILRLAQLQKFYSAKANISSNNCPLIRIADIISNLLFKLSYNIYESLKEEEYTGVNDRNFEKKRLLNSQWFDIKREEVYKLYVELYKVIKQRSDIYWTVYSGIYMDYTVLTFCIISYIGNEFSDFGHFQSLNSLEHQDKFNTYVCNHLEERYKYFR